MKEFFIADAARFDNQTVTSFFCLASLSLRERKGGGQYLALTLADKTGQIEARMWEEFASVLETCSEGCYVKVQGQISKYQGKFQITLARMRSAADAEIDTTDFVPTTQFDIGEMMSELRGYVEAFTNGHLQRLVLRLLDDPAIGPAFQQAPAAKRLHHAWLGGLLEHVLTLVRVCRGTAPFYPEVDPDLLVAGAILHDIGKVRELSWRSSFSYTLEGQLIGHISIGQRMLADIISAMNTEARQRAEADGQQPAIFPESLRLLLEHMLLAHHGKYEFGSPKLPMTPEALLLSTLDDLEAKFQTMRSEFASAHENGRGAEETTEWVRSMDRSLFDSRRFLAAQASSSLELAGTAEAEIVSGVQAEASAEVDAGAGVPEPVELVD
ncbi:MAG TPA: OB-fold nucleic acid binding domain-containing protein [Acidobacteriaceae bacterium]|jgi:3'-5' exoribonuclease|nr:OB-fold nucleic acid binding domain-containing protein [Acidobacteriaceae bacterium]